MRDKIKISFKKCVGILILLFWTVAALPEADAGMGEISGRILDKSGKPAASGFVLIYKKSDTVPFNTGQYRSEPYEVASIEENGVFHARLQAGAYYLEAVLRSSGNIIGPPGTGDYFMVGLNTKGDPMEYVIEPGKKTDTGNLGVFTRYKGLTSETVGTGITGVVLDANGRPASDAVVFAYTDVSMTGNASFISDMTGQDGKYVLGVYKGGSYYLTARDMSDEYMRGLGVYGGMEPVPVILKTGDVISGIDIGN